MNRNIDALYAAIEKIYQMPEIRDREFYADFRRSWDAVLKKAFHSSVSYLPEDAKAIYTVEQEFLGINLRLHFDQLKIYDWYQKEVERKSKNIFVSKKLKRSYSKVLTLDKSVCRYEADAKEPALSEDMKNIIACALPGNPPELCVVYGNKWVDSKFTIFRQRSLSLYFMNTDFVPAFLGTPREVAMYLFLMDCGFIIFNYKEVKDKDLKQFLHIFRPSPMLKIKGLIG